MHYSIAACEPINNNIQLLATIYTGNIQAANAIPRNCEIRTLYLVTNLKFLFFISVYTSVDHIIYIIGN